MTSLVLTILSAWKEEKIHSLALQATFVDTRDLPSQKYTRNIEIFRDLVGHEFQELEQAVANGDFIKAATLLHGMLKAERSNSASQV